MCCVLLWCVVCFAGLGSVQNDVFLIQAESHIWIANRQFQCGMEQPLAPIKMKFYKGDFYYVHTFQNLKGRFPLDQTRFLHQFQCGIQKHSRFLIHFALTLETLHQCLLLLFNPIFVD